MKQFKGEKIEHDIATKKVYHFHDTDLGINQISKEIFKKKDLIIHYPRGFEGGNKYKTINKFHYIGFKGKLPVGVYKSPSYGYGFTKQLNPFSNYIDDNFNFTDVKIEKNGKVAIDKSNKILYLNESSLEILHKELVSIYNKNKVEVNIILLDCLHSLFPSDIKESDRNYIPDSLSISLASWGNEIKEFSDNDKNAIKELFDKLTVNSDFLTKNSLAKTKEIIDIKYIKETLKNFNSLYSLKTDGDSLEKNWQNFLKENNWVFSTIFSQPVILYKDEVYVGGKNIDNKNGKFNDFLIKNRLSNNVSFLEIKTHKTKLIENTPYRGNDVFCISKDLSGCINQVLNQRDNFQKEFYHLKVKSKANFETFNSKCVVLIGALEELTSEQLSSFELFRNNSKDVEILTFDELKKKIESLQSIMGKK